jgi:hypothetical protein
MQSEQQKQKRDNDRQFPAGTAIVVAGPLCSWRATVISTTSTTVKAALEWRLLQKDTTFQPSS